MVKHKVQRVRTIPQALARAAKIAIPGSALALMLAKMSTSGQALGLRGLGVGPAKGGYAEKVLGACPIAYWPLDEISGNTAYCLVNPAQNGAYTGVTLANDTTGPFGTPAPFYDGANDYCNIYSAALAAAFNGAEGTFLAWARVNAAGVWGDAAFRHVIDLRTADADYNVMRKSNTPNDCDWLRRAGAAVDTNVVGINVNALVGTNWFHMAWTWSETADEVMAYIDGAQVGVTVNGLGAWSGALVNNQCTIGSFGTVPNTVWHGWLGHVAILDRAAGQPEIADLAVV